MNVLLRPFRRLPALCALALLTGVSSYAPAATNQKVSAPSCTHKVTVTSKPCGATIYIDGLEVGRTPMSFPMPTGRYTLVVLAAGHQGYAQRILVPDGPLSIEAQLVPLK